MCRSLVSILKKMGKKLGEGGGGWSKWKLRNENCVFATAKSQLLNVNYGFLIANYGIGFALCELEFKVFTLAIDFQLRIVTFGNRFLILSSHF